MKLPAERAIKVGGLTWHVIDTRGKKGSPVLVMLPGTLGTAAIFRDPIERLGARVRMVSVTYPLIDDIHRRHSDTRIVTICRRPRPATSATGARSRGGSPAR